MSGYIIHQYEVNTCCIISHKIFGDTKMWLIFFCGDNKGTFIQAKHPEDIYLLLNSDEDQSQCAESSSAPFKLYSRGIQSLFILGRGGRGTLH